MRAKITKILGCLLLGIGGTHAAAQQRSPQNIRHAYLVTGAQTAIISETDQILWRYPRNTRDGCVLESGNVLLVLNSGKNASPKYASLWLRKLTIPKPKSVLLEPPPRVVY